MVYHAYILSFKSISLTSGSAGDVLASSIPASTIQPASTAAASGNSNAAEINQATLIGIIAGGAGFLLLVFILATVYIVRRRRKRKRAQAGTSSEEEQIPQRGHLYPEAPHRNSLLGDPRARDTYTRL